MNNKNNHKDPQEASHKSHKENKMTHEEHLEAIARELNQLTHEGILFTPDGDSMIDSIITQLTILRFSGYSDFTDSAITDYFNELTRNTLLELEGPV